MEPLADRVRDIIGRRCPDGVAPAAATPLFGGGLDLDSVAFLELVMEIEERLGIRLRDEDLSAGALSCLGAFVAHVVAVAGRRA